MAVVVALDIDGVLNNLNKHTEIVDFVNQNDGILELPRHEIAKQVMANVEGVEYIPNRHGDWIVRSLANRLKTSLHNKDVIIVGVSSWFKPGRDQINAFIIKWLGLDEHTFLVNRDTSGSMGRCRALEQLVFELMMISPNIEKLIILDDQEVGYNNIELNLPIVHICPQWGLTNTDFDVLDNELKDTHNLK